MNRTVLAVTIAASFILAACGGGGGGGGSSSTSNINLSDARNLTSQTTRVGSFNTLDRPTSWFSAAFLYTGDFTGNGLEDVIAVGRITAPGTAAPDPAQYPNYIVNIIVQDSDGVFRVATNEFFHAGENVIVGSDAVVVADFNLDGRADVFILGGTDTEYRPPSYFFLSGSDGKFSRQEIPTYTWGHGIDAFDITGNGVPEIFTAGFDPYHHYLRYVNGQLVMNRMVGPDGSSAIFGASDVAVGRFLGTGTQVIRSDDLTRDRSRSTMMYNITQLQNGDLALTYHSTLPPGRFELPKWNYMDIDDSDGFRSHDVRVYRKDITGNGVLDAVILSGPWHDSQGNWPGGGSEVQLLINYGNGVFLDETDTRLRNFDTSLAGAHYLRFIDLNGDGCTDIYIDGHAFSERGSKRFLLSDCSGNYTQANIDSMERWSQELDDQRTSKWNPYSKSTPMTVVKGNNGNLYMVWLTYADLLENNQWQATVFSRRLSSEFLQ